MSAAISTSSSVLTFGYCTSNSRNPTATTPSDFRWVAKMLLFRSANICCTLCACPLAALGRLIACALVFTRFPRHSIVIVWFWHLFLLNFGHQKLSAYRVWSSLFLVSPPQVKRHLPAITPIFYGEKIPALWRVTIRIPQRGFIWLVQGQYVFSGNFDICLSLYLLVCSDRATRYQAPFLPTLGFLCY